MSSYQNTNSISQHSSSRSQAQMGFSAFYGPKSGATIQNSTPKMEVIIIGKNSDPELEFIIQQSEMWINNDIDYNEDMLCFNDCVEIEIVTLHQTHFEYILKELKRKSPEILSHASNSPIILINSTRYVPSLIRLIATFVLELGLPKDIFVRSLPYTFNQQNDYLLQLTQMTHSKLLQYFNFSETYTYVFFDVKLKNGIIECKRKVKSMTSFRMTVPEVQKISQFRIIVQLNSKVMPKTCFNFYQLCQGNFKNSKGQRLTYKNTSFHAIQKNAFIQGGSFQDRDRDESIFGPTFEDESYAIKHDQPGIVGMANQGIPHTNGSQFYITLGNQPDKDHKYVAFGLVVFGMKYLRKLNKLTDKSSFSPAIEARIINCGEYNFCKLDFIHYNIPLIIQQYSLEEKVDLDLQQKILGDFIIYWVQYSLPSFLAELQKEGNREPSSKIKSTSNINPVLNAQTQTNEIKLKIGKISKFLYSKDFNIIDKNEKKDDFVSETKKDFDLLDNSDTINTQLALAARQKQERSFSTIQPIMPKIETVNYNRIQIKKDKDQFASQKERFKSTFSKQTDYYGQRPKNTITQKSSVRAKLNNTFQEYNNSKNDDRLVELIKPQNKELFKQYKKELDDQPIFQFQNYHLLSERGGAGKYNKRIQESKLKSHQDNFQSNQLLKMQVNSLGAMQNLGSINKIPESSSNLDMMSKRVPQTLSPTMNFLDGKRKSQNSLYGEQYLLKLLNLPNIQPSPSKDLNGYNKLQGISPALSTKSRDPFQMDNQSNQFNSHQNLSEKEDLFDGSDLGSKLTLNQIKKQITPFGNPLLDYLNSNLLPTGQGLQFRRVPNIEKVHTNSYKTQRLRINSNSNTSITEQTKTRFNMNSIISIQNGIRNQNTLKKQSSLQNQIFDDVSQKIISNSKEELGSLIIISQIYHKKIQDDQLKELTNIIPGLSESIAMQLPISLKKSLSLTQEQIFLNRQLTQELQIPHVDTKDTLLNMSKQIGFDISEVDDDW